MNVIITGGTGYLGSRLVRRFLDIGHHILCLTIPDDPCINLADIREKINFVCTKDPFMMENICAYRPDVVVHTATVYERGNATIDQVFEANLEFPFHVLCAAMQGKAKRWINTATSLPDGINSYSLSKAQFGEWGRLLAHRGGLEFVNLKLEHFYGENGPDTHFLTQVTRKLKANEPLDLTVGTQHRDFVYIGDIVDCFAHMLTAPVDGFMEVHIGTGVSPSIREVVEYLKYLSGSVSELRFGAVPLRENEPDCVCDTAEMKSLGMECKYSWREGMKKLI